MYGAKRNYLIWAVEHPTDKEVINPLFKKEFTIIAHNPNKKYDDTFTMTIKNEDLEIVFDYVKEVTKTLITPLAYSFEVRVPIVIEKISIHKKSQTFILDDTIREGFELFLKEVLWFYSKNIKNMINGDACADKVSLDKKECYVASRKEILAYLEKDPMFIVKLAKSTKDKIFTAIDGRKYYKEYIRNKNKLRHETIKVLKSDRGILRVIKRKFFKVKKNPARS